MQSEESVQGVQGEQSKQNFHRLEVVQQQHLQPQERLANPQQLGGL